MPPARPRPTSTDRVAPDLSQGLSTPLQFVKGVGPQRAKLLGKLGLETVDDALFQLPVRHEDRSHLVPLRSIAPAEALTATGIVAGISPAPHGRARAPLQVLLQDGSGFLNAIWFNQPYLERLFKRGQRLIVHGKVQPYGRGPLQMHVKDFEIAEECADENLHTGRLVPVYGLTRGLTQRPMRTLMKRLVEDHSDSLEETLPPALLARRGLGPLGRDQGMSLPRARSGTGRRSTPVDLR